MRFFEAVAQAVIFTTGTLYVFYPGNAFGSFFPPIAWCLFVMSAFMLVNYKNAAMQEIIVRSAMKPKIPYVITSTTDIYLIVLMAVTGHYFLSICFVFGAISEYLIRETKKNIEALAGH